jgi:hypothetical protein
VSEPTSFNARELFAVLARYEVDYVTIGGIAVQAHGGQRVTQDLDIAIATATDNRTRLAAALVDLDARILGPDGKRSTSPPSATMLGASDLWHLVTPHGLLDIVTFPAHLGSFDELRARAHNIPLGDLTVPIAHRDDLLEMKRATGRPQDLADVRLLESLEDEDG